ncbi:MAG: hypothetical protein AAGI34_06950 [Pseudomonadota bacterium]
MRRVAAVALALLAAACASPEAPAPEPAAPAPLPGAQALERTQAALALYEGACLANLSDLAGVPAAFEAAGLSSTAQSGIWRADNAGVLGGYRTGLPENGRQCSVIVAGIEREVFAAKIGAVLAQRLSGARAREEAGGLVWRVQREGRRVVAAVALEGARAGRPVTVALLEVYPGGIGG